MLLNLQRQALFSEVLPSHQDDTTFNCIFQLPYITRPVVRGKLPQAIRCNRIDGSAILFGKSFNEKINQQFDITLPFSKRGNFKSYHVESVIEVLSEVSILYFLL